MKKILFICSQNCLRSPTAEKVFSGLANIQTRSAGFNPDSNVVVSRELIEWATMIVVMEKHHMDKLKKKFKSDIKGKRVVCLNIPDDYDFMDEVLVQLLKGRMARYLV
jgi:predicted protein tyrosine phosphatase